MRTIHSRLRARGLFLVSLSLFFIFSRTPIFRLRRPGHSRSGDPSRHNQSGQPCRMLTNDALQSSRGSKRSKVLPLFVPTIFCRLLAFLRCIARDTYAHTSVDSLLLFLYMRGGEEEESRTEGCVRCPFSRPLRRCENDEALSVLEPP